MVTHRTTVARADEPDRTRGDRTRRAILDAAQASFRAVGFEATKLTSVATAAGVAGPTVAFHFRSKDGLLQAVIEDYYAGLIAAAETVIDEPASPPARLQAFARFWLQALDGDFPLFSVFVTRGAFGDAEGQTADVLRRNSARIVRMFERLVDDLKADGTIRDDISTRAVRDAFFGTAEHVLRGRIVSTKPIDHARAADDLLALLLGGIGAQRPAVVAEADRLDALEAKLDAVLARLGA